MAGLSSAVTKCRLLHVNAIYNSVSFLYIFLTETKPLSIRELFAGRNLMSSAVGKVRASGF